MLHQSKKIKISIRSNFYLYEIHVCICYDVHLSQQMQGAVMIFKVGGKIYICSKQPIIVTISWSPWPGK